MSEALFDIETTYPHCKHCCWNNPFHTETHDTPCWSGCSGEKPIGGAA